MVYQIEATIPTPVRVRTPKYPFIEMRKLAAATVLAAVMRRKVWRKA